jgi:hypothetical protein
MSKAEINLGVQALYEVAFREPLHTGFPPGLLQDDCAGLSRWLASRPDARRRVREALEALDKQEKNHE